MEPSDNGLTLELNVELSQIEMELAATHADAIEAHLDHVRKDAFEQGRKAEVTKTESKDAELNAKKRQETQQVLEALTHAVPDLLQQAESALKQLAITVAQRFVASCPIDEERIHGLLKEALAEIEDSSKIIVHLHPEDLALIASSTDEITSKLSNPQSIQFKPSPELTRGGCRVETDFGQLDASVESKRQQINTLIVGSGIAA